MDAADNRGNGDTAATAGVTEQPVRYIITRPCLAEGSLRLLKYLQATFPADGELTLLDTRGERFTAHVDAPRTRLTGMGELYRAHNLGVNDVLMLQRTGERDYTVSCVVKPHARSGPAPERPAPPAPVTEKRVVIHATPHVREVRMERVSPETVRTTEDRSSREVTDRAGTDDPRTQQAAGEGRKAAERPTPAGMAPAESAPATGAARPATPAPATPAPANPAPTNSGPVPAAPMKALTARMQQRPVGAAGPGPAVVQLDFPVSRVQPQSGPQTGPSARAQSQVRPPELQGAPPVSSSGSASGPAVKPEAASRAAPSGRAQGQATAVQVPPQQKTVLRAEPPAPPSERAQNPEDQLAALARLTGYTCEHLGSGVVRLRAELGSHGYSVLIATTPQALTTPAWNESCDYMALLTPEDERPQGIPRFTHGALEALLEHARLAPLTPIDLRGYWNTGSFDQDSVESVAELVSAHLAQRGSFSHVLVTLAQQPAHSLVQLPRLAERLGSGVNTAELQSILETLSRPPFLALTPLPGGQYYLRSEVHELLQEFGEYAEGMRRRLRAPLATAGR